MKVDTIIHTAALTGIRECEENKPKAWKDKCTGYRKFNRCMFKVLSNVYFIYISTPCVFDGHRGMYNENDIPCPENFYALTKLIGEFAVKKLSNHLIIRTNFVAKEKWRYPKAFTDRYGTYLLAAGCCLRNKKCSRESVTRHNSYCGRFKNIHV